MTQVLRLIKGATAQEGKRSSLEIRSLSKVFKAPGGAVTVLENMDFAVYEGELLCVLGPSGCGKTTLLNILAGFISPSSGSAALGGQQVTGPGPDRCVVFQEDTLFPWLTVRENIAFGIKGVSRKDKAAEAQRFLDLVGLGAFGDYLPREISGGMKKRVSLARVLVLNPRVLLMDEPFGALDAQTREEMQDLLLSLRKQFRHTIVFVTHDIDEAVTLADRILLMDRNPGRIAGMEAIGLPRPRERTGQPFQDHCKRLYSLIKRDRA